jgi:DNA invertase Pin-like site-specific DNA recombinase
MQSVKRRAAQYLRMSTERQDYSLTFQEAAIAAYAEANGYEVVTRFVDEGISGIGIENRHGLQNLLSTVVSAGADFDVILVYDVSRWGRFQNPDQAAHYEFICNEAGVRIEYCAESFANDASPTSALLKHIKRAMAAEYSRELSTKVRRAQTGLKRAGFWMGSTPGFGFRREAVATDGSSLGLLADGQYNPYPGAHTRLALGPPEELETVRRAFALYLEPGGTFVSVANDLNCSGRAGLFGLPWDARRTRKLLLDRRYAGDLIINQRRTELGVTTAQPADEWQVVAGAVPAIVDKKTFEAVQRRQRERQRRVTQRMAMADLRRVFAQTGRISHKVLLKHGRWTPRVYTSRLGDMDMLYELCGAERPKSHRLKNLEAARRARLERGSASTEERLLSLLRALLEREGYLTARLIEASKELPCVRTYQLRFGALAVAYEKIGYRPKSSRQASAIRLSLARVKRGGSSVDDAVAPQ